MASISPALPERYIPWPSPDRSLLGKGGASEVWRVKDRYLDVLVALKVLRREGARFQARLEREAALSARIHHPKVVAVHDIGRTPEGLSFIAFALANGGSMLDIGARPPPWPELLVLLGDLLESLAACHARGILHLDVKLSNLLLHHTGPGGRRVLWLADLGVARARFEDVDQSVIGTVSYMAPERLTGQHHLWAPSSDLFSVGAVLYRMLVGQLPFPAREPVEGLAERRHPPDTVPVRGGYRVPPGLDDIVLAMLQPDPRGRFDLAADALRALRALPELSPAARPEAVAPVNPAGHPAEPAPLGVPTWFRPAPRLPPTRLWFPEPNRRVPQAPSLLMHREIPLVGRDAEMELLGQVAREVIAEGTPRMVHLSGPRGSGRTRLVEEFVRLLEEEGLGEGVPLQYAVGEGPAFGLRGGWRRIAPPPVSDREKDHRKYPGQLAAGLARDRGCSLEAAIPDARILARWIDPSGDEPVTDRAFARAGLIEHLKHRSWRGLSWLWLEDVHLADSNDDAWTVVDQLLGLDVPVLVLSSSRSDVLAPSLLELATRHRHRVRGIALRPLQTEQAEELADTYLPLHPALRRQLVEQTAGSPQYMKDVLLHWNRAELLERTREGDNEEPVWTLVDGAPPPPADRNAFARELLQFTMDAKPELLEPLLALALAGRGTPEEVLTQVVGDQLDQLIVTGLVSLEGGTPVLSPLELQDELPSWAQEPGLVQQLHARLAAAWAREGDDPAVWARVGRHLSAAGEPRSALAPLDRALMVLQHTRPVPEIIELAQLARQAAIDTGSTGDDAWARATRILSAALGRAGQLAQALQLDQELAMATLDLRQQVMAATVHATHLAETQGPDIALERLEAFEDQVSLLPPRVRATYFATRATCLAAAMRPADAHADIQAALSHQPTPPIETQVRLLRAQLLTWADPSVCWHEALRSIELARDHGLLRGEVGGWGLTAEKLVQLGNTGEALSRLDAGLARLRAHGDRFAAARLLLLKGDTLRSANRPAEAWDAWLEAEAECRGRADSIRSRARISRATLAVAQDRAEAVQELLPVLQGEQAPAAEVAVALLQTWLSLKANLPTELPLAATVALGAQLGLEGLTLVDAVTSELHARGRGREAQRLEQVLALSCRVLGLPGDLASRERQARTGT